MQQQPQYSHSPLAAHLQTGSAVNQGLQLHRVKPTSNMPAISGSVPVASASASDVKGSGVELLRSDVHCTAMLCCELVWQKPSWRLGTAQRCPSLVRTCDLAMTTGQQQQHQRPLQLLLVSCNVQLGRGCEGQHRWQHITHRSARGLPLQWEGLPQPLLLSKVHMQHEWLDPQRPANIFTGP